MRELEIGQKIHGVRDYAQALKGQEGTFLVTQPGITQVVVCQHGRSIISVRSAGSPFPGIVVGQITSDWSIEKLNNSTAVPGGLGQGEESQYRTGDRGPAGERR